MSDHSIPARPDDRPELDDTHTANSSPIHPAGGLGVLDDPLSSSPPVSGMVTLWTPHGRARWHAHDPELLSAILGHGPIDGRWQSWTVQRDTATLTSGAVLHVLVPEITRDRVPRDWTLAFHYRVLPVPGDLIEHDDAAATSDEWNEFGRWIGDVAEHAFDRGDDVIVEHMTSDLPKRACTVVELSVPDVRIATYRGGRRPRRAPSRRRCRCRATRWGCWVSRLPAW